MFKEKKICERKLAFKLGDLSSSFNRIAYLFSNFDKIIPEEKKDEFFRLIDWMHRLSDENLGCDEFFEDIWEE